MNENKLLNDLKNYIKEENIELYLDMVSFRKAFLFCRSNNKNIGVFKNQFICPYNRQIGCISNNCFIRKKLENILKEGEIN